MGLEYRISWWQSCVDDFGDGKFGYIDKVLSVLKYVLGVNMVGLRLKLNSSVD